MNPLRAALDDIVADVPEYGDLDRAFEQAAQDHRRRLDLVAGLAAVAAVLAVIAGTVAITRAYDSDPRPLGPVIQPNEPSDSPDTPDGELTPGRHRYVLRDQCVDPDSDCPPGARIPPAPLRIDFTVPAGWQQLEGFPNVIAPVRPGPTAGPDGAAVVLAWTNYFAGLYSDPCLGDEPGPPDIPVGGSVDDFVDAVQAQDALDVTAPSDVRLGGHPGRFFTLRVPADISDCEHWVPWDPGFYAQGPNNIWDVWVIDVDGFRVLVVAHHYPGTPPLIRSQVRAIAESVEFPS